MVRNTAGMSTLMVMLVLTMLAVCAMLVMRSTTYLVDIAHKRAIYEQQYRAAEGLLQYGVALAVQHAPALFKKAGGNMPAYTVTLDEWPPHSAPSMQRYTGVVTLRPAVHNVIIMANLMANSKTVCVLGCELVQQEKGLVIQHWQHG